MSLLHLCKGKQFDRVNQLLSGTQYDTTLLNEQDQSGRCALHHAVLHDSPATCEALLRAGASPNVQDGQGNTALHLSLSDAHKTTSASGKQKMNACSQVLFGTNNGYDWRLQDAFGRTAIHWICTHGLKDALQELCKSALYAQQDNSLNSAIDSVADEKKQSDTEIAGNRSISDAFSLQNKSGQTCMHWAVDKQQTECVYLLLELAEKDMLDLSIKDNQGLLAFNLCTDELVKQQIWDVTKRQIDEHDKQAKADSAQKFSVSAGAANNTKALAAGSSIKAKKSKSKGKKKMKIKLKKK